MRWLATSAVLAALACSPGILAHQQDAAPSASVPSHTHEGGIRPAPDSAVLAPFDIVHAKITTLENIATFHMAVSGHAGSSLPTPNGRSEEHTSELQSLMRISYDVFCLKKKNKQ